MAKARLCDNRELINEKKRLVYAQNKARKNKTRRDARLENPGVEASKQREMRLTLRLKCLQKYGARCLQCGITDHDILCFDHVNNNGAEERSKSPSITILRRILKDVSGSYCILCFNCNHAKQMARKEAHVDLGIIKSCPTCNRDLDLCRFKCDKKYPDGVYYECRECDRERVRNLKLQAISTLKNQACPCGVSDPTMLTFDHVNNDGSKHRASNPFPVSGRYLYTSIVSGRWSDLFQVLCVNCNIKKYVCHRSITSRLQDSLDESHVEDTYFTPVVASHTSERIVPRPFLLSDLTVCREEQSVDITRLFTLNHYAGFGRFSRHIYTARLGPDLVAIAKFNYSLTKSMATAIGVEYRNVLELDRLVTNPAFVNKNTLSYVLSRVTRLIKNDLPNITHLISFADPDQGHHGGVYKAANWVPSGLTTRSYVYITGSGETVHKKTVWNAARKLGIKEDVHASRMGLRRKYSNKKYRFVLQIRPRDDSIGAV